MMVGQNGGSSDTPEGCRAHADQDRARAKVMDTDNGRLRLEGSAAAWDARASDLDGLSQTCDARRAAAIIEWDQDESTSRDEDETGEGPDVVL
jgi:hypothetical protein